MTCPKPWTTALFCSLPGLYILWFVLLLMCLQTAVMDVAGVYIWQELPCQSQTYGLKHPVIRLELYLSCLKDILDSVILLNVLFVDFLFCFEFVVSRLLTAFWVKDNYFTCALDYAFFTPVYSSHVLLLFHFILWFSPHFGRFWQVPVEKCGEIDWDV